MHARASWCTAFFLVFLRCVGPRCVGLTRKISAYCDTGSYVFSFFFIFIFILFPALSHMNVIFIPSARSLRFGIRLWKVNIDQNDQNWNLFYYFLFQRTPVIYNFLKIMFFYLLFISIRKLGPISFFVSWLQKTMFATTSTEKSKAIPFEKFAISTCSFLINFTSHAFKLRQH